jgi:hypothetical protein
MNENIIIANRQLTTDDLGSTTSFELKQVATCFASSALSLNRTLSMGDFIAMPNLNRSSLTNDLEGVGK